MIQAKTKEDSKEEKATKVAFRIITLFAKRYADLLEVGSYWHRRAPSGTYLCSDALKKKDEFRTTLACQLAVIFRYFGILTEEAFLKLKKELVDTQGEVRANLVVEAMKETLRKLDRDVEEET